MNDPERLVQRGASPFEERLLRAGRGDAVSDNSRRAIVSGLGLGGALSAGAAVAAAQKAGKGWLGVSALRWVGGGAISAAAVWASVAAWNHPEQASVPAPPSVSVAAPPAMPAPSNAEPVASDEPALDSTPVDSQQRQLPARARSRTIGEKSNDSLADELAAVEQARRALIRKDAAQSLRLLDDYTRRFSPRRLDAEATVLRIEALAQSGDRAGAQRLGQSFLAKNPQGPYARRVRSLIGANAGEP
ncbi:MAG: hypothetical protein ACOY0T_13245 [Myxococcota bacterium]